MAIETNKRIMHRFTEFINTASEKLAAELISPNAVFHVPGRPEPLQGPAGYHSFLGNRLYEDANSFFRAFHHWEGTSPGQWREFQKNSQQATQTHLATPATRRRASVGLHRTIKGGGL